MTETPEQRRKRLARVIYDVLTGPPWGCTSDYGGGKTVTVDGTSDMHEIACAIIASDEAAGVVCVPRRTSKPYVLHADGQAVHELRGPIADVYATLIDAAQGMSVGSEP